MLSPRFLIPLGAAVAALLPFKVQAALNPPSTEQSTDSALRVSPSANPTLGDPVIQEIAYMVQSEVHALLLRQSNSGILYAGHGSHRSHGSHESHSSHGSHRSGY